MGFFMKKTKITNTTALLRENLHLLLQENKFEVGQIVKWKKGSQNSLRNKEYPDDDQEAIVVSVLDETIESDSEVGTSDFKEPLDLILGMIDEDGGFITFYYDSRRFEHVKNSDY